MILSTNSRTRTRPTMWVRMLGIFVLYDLLWRENSVRLHNDSSRWVTPVVAAAATTSSTTGVTSQCNLYLAQSTIPGAGLGVFAGPQDYNPGDAVSYSDIVIPIEDITYHNGGMYKDYEFLWEEYTWSTRPFPGMEQETEGSDMHELHVTVASPGFGSAANSMLNLFNVDDDNQRTFSVDTAGLYFIGNNYRRTSLASSSSSSEKSIGRRGSRPGVGAFTPYNGRVFFATKYIPAGMELFVNYGPHYFRSRPQYDSMPMVKDYRLADDLIKKFFLMHQKACKYGDPSKVCKYDKVYNSGWKLLLQDMKHIWKESPGMQAFPDNVETLNQLWNWNGTKSGGSTSYQHYNRSIQSIDWLQENGVCMDNIKHGISTIPQAGRGAFATRPIPKGSIVAPAPLVHIPKKPILDRYNFTDEEQITGNIKKRDPSAKPVHRQLLLNYCFGHSQSTMLLCPYGILTGLINHSHKLPNTKIEWSNIDMTRKQLDEWKDLPLSHWTPVVEHTGLVFDFVALRDIEEGEEILIDYGVEWETAWQQHLSTFEEKVPIERREYYIPAFELNKMVEHDEKFVLRTADERSYMSDGVVLRIRNKHIFQHDVLRTKPKYGRSNQDVIIIQRNKRRVFANNSNSKSSINGTTTNVGQEEYRYVVQLVWTSSGYNSKSKADKANTDPEPTSCDFEASPILWDTPKDAFYFEDLPRKQDHNQHWSFRHEMMVPDDVFPEAWKNLKKKKKKATTTTSNGKNEL